jgi:guanosine-3',5'-bis(diphosphate) 3'-pyrophosphohydrolase
MNKKVVQLMLERFTSAERAQIEAALAFATLAHEGQLRRSGEPYIIHPAAVARILIDLGMDVVTIQAALLHDTVEDTEVTLADIEAKFGAKVAELVDGVTKIGQVKHQPDASLPDTPRAVSSAENIRKLLLAMSKDIRVIIIKRTLQWLSAEKQQRIARESLDIYAPLADRLGIGGLKTEIEDLSFQYLMPLEYERVQQLVATKRAADKQYLVRLQELIREQLQLAGIATVAVEGRHKHAYSVYRKLMKADGDIEKIYDLLAIRIIVPTEGDCYQTLGILHQNFKPLIYRIKDYIAVPKPNGYRSLHTTVFALDGQITEIQIRTPEMHEEAERGLAAHFHYNEQKVSAQYQDGHVSTVPSKLHWVNSLADISRTAATGTELVEDLEVDLFRDRIFLFTPKGDLYDMPEGATPLDFAFAVHTDIGLRTAGAKVNGRIVPLDSALANRDVVEVLTRKLPSPSRDWLTTVKTASARNKIRAWYRKQSRDENMASGRQLLEAELRIWNVKKLEDIEPGRWAQLVDGLNLKDFDTLLAAIGEGMISVAQVSRRLFPPVAPVFPAYHRLVEAATSEVVIEGTADLAYTLAVCCNPVYPKLIVGYVTRGSGVTVHVKDCPNIPDEPDRIVVTRWLAQLSDFEICDVRIVANNRIGLLRDITSTVSAQRLNIIGLDSRGEDDRERSEVTLTVEVGDLHQLVRLMKAIKRLPDIISVERLSQNTPAR